MGQSDKRCLQNKGQKETNYWLVTVTVGCFISFFLLSYFSWLILFIPLNVNILFVKCYVLGLIKKTKVN
jgi:uncharacterized membrane protein